MMTTRTMRRRTSDEQRSDVTTRVSAALLLFIAAGAGADTLWVDASATGPGDGSATNPFILIQEAVDAASSGDEIVLRDGTYYGVGNRRVEVPSMDLTIRSVNGPLQTFIGGENIQLMRINGPGSGTVALQGLTFLNGSTFTNGGAVRSIDAAVEFIDCRFDSNEATDDGGAVYAEGSDLGFTECRFIDNTAQRGGAIDLNDSTASFLDCRFGRASLTRGNISNGRGGALSMRRSAVSLESTSFYDCASTTNRGGAMVVEEGSTAVIIDGEFESCDSELGGGAIYASSSGLEIETTRFTGNSSNTNGGAIRARDDAT
ncbi:MAG: hypothetical protein KDA28_09330, partial [Phycisphaerales bacterium]|nr:hypothetical protein [Phycisphaerales bacterium]